MGANRVVFLLRAMRAVRDGFSAPTVLATLARSASSRPPTIANSPLIRALESGSPPRGIRSAAAVFLTFTPVV